MKNMVEVRNLSFKYSKDGPEVLGDLSFSAPQGSITAITGPSGSGKSTLACCIAGIIPKNVKGEMSGSVELNGRAGIVFQDPDTQIFLPSVEDEIAFGPENLCLSPELIGGRIETSLALTGMSEFRDKGPNRLSGGERQMIVFAAVLAMEPDILVCDEVTAFLDETGKIRVAETFTRLKAEGKTIIMIEHNRDMLALADKTYTLAGAKLLEGSR